MTHLNTDKTDIVFHSHSFQRNEFDRNELKITQITLFRHHEPKKIQSALWIYDPPFYQRERWISRYRKPNSVQISLHCLHTVNFQRFYYQHDLNDLNSILWMSSWFFRDCGLWSQEKEWFFWSYSPGEPLIWAFERLPSKLVLAARSLLSNIFLTLAKSSKLHNWALGHSCPNWLKIVINCLLISVCAFWERKHIWKNENYLFWLWTVLVNSAPSAVFI